MFRCVCPVETGSLLRIIHDLRPKHQGMDRSLFKCSRLGSATALAIILFLGGSAASARSNNTAFVPGSDSVGYIPRLNLIKFGTTSTIVKAISLQYERVLNPVLSVALTVTYLTPKQPEQWMDLSTDKITIDQDRKLGGIYITPEVKWFVEKSDRRPAPRGLYVGAYLRYSDTRYTSSFSAITTTAATNGSIDGSLKIDLFEYGVGPSVGYQFLCIHDRLVFDALFFAPRFVMYKLKVEADLHGDGDLIEDLSQALEDKLGRDITPVDVDLSTTGSTTIDRNSFGYRFGIKIGYAF